MKTLSLDLSTKSSGWAVFKDKDLQDSGCFVDGSANVLKRIIYMTSRIEELICTNDIDEVIIEEVLPEDVRHNQKVYKSLMYLQASVVLMLFKHNLNANFFTSSEWRKKCGIHTGAGIKRDTLKAADINFVKEHYNKDVNDDIADAICIGYAYTNKAIPVTTKKEKPTTIIIDDFEFK